MANLNYRSQFVNSFAGQQVELLLKVSIGATGAPTLVSKTGMGVASVVRVSAGRYTINLSNPFFSLLAVDVKNRSSAAPAAPIVAIATDSVNAIAAPLVVIQCYNAAGTTATDPASGEVMYIVLKLNRSSLPN